MAANLFDIKLPEGDVPGFDIGGHLQNGSRFFDPAIWLSQGYTGVRFIGAGKGRTRIIPAPGVWVNIFIAQHAGEVHFESLSVHGRGQTAIHAGNEHPARVIKRFLVSLEDFELIADEPVPGLYNGGRAGWGLFTTQANVRAKHGNLWWGAAREHAFYMHHLASPTGAVFEDLHFYECAAECIKGRFDTDEALWAGRNVSVSVRNCVFKDWYRPWSSRGGGGVVMQGIGANLVIEENEFWAPSDASHTRCIMVDDNPNDGAAQFFDPDTGRVGVGKATGNIVIRRNVFRAGPGTENLTPCIRVGNLFAGTHKVAKSLLIEQNAIYGRNLQLQLSNIPSLTVRENNTPQAKEYAQALGVDVTFEAGIPTHDAVIPLSKYAVQAAPKP